MKRKISLILCLMTLVAAASWGQTTLKNTVGKYFLIGTALNNETAWEIDSVSAKIAKENFNSIVAENVMKMDELHPEENTFYWKQADRFVKFGMDNNMTVIGHVLIWHSQAPDWFFTDENGKYVSREVLIDRMYHHITTIVKHFKGKVKGWDVVNEAFNDDGTYRESPFYKILGKDFIPFAFKFAHAADPGLELYYNDYSLSNPKKRAAVCQLVRELKAQGLRIDAVGMQSHNGTDYPDLSEYEASIKAFINEGVKVQITELDLNMLPNPKEISGAEISQKAGYTVDMDPYKKGLTRKAQKVFNDRYLAFFSLYKKYAKDIERVTIWGVTDKESWLNNWPIKGRTNYPLLFDREGNEKPVVKEIEKMFP